MSELPDTTAELVMEIYLVCNN